MRLFKGVILSGAGFQAEGRISRIVAASGFHAREVVGVELWHRHKIRKLR